MKQQNDIESSATDAAFVLQGRFLPRDNAWALEQALIRLAPWLKDDPAAAVHPVKLVDGNDDPSMISGRSRLLMRVSKSNLQALKALAGAGFDLQGHAVQLGALTVRDLQAHHTLYAPRVAAESKDEVAFMEWVWKEVLQMGMNCKTICGKYHRIESAQGHLDTFSLMLHELTPEQSLQVQQSGLGPHRLMGCGLFIPHKSAYAV